MKVYAMMIAGVAVALVGAWMAAGYLPVRNIETPKYEVVSVHKGYEIRQYQTHIVAEVKVQGTYKESVNQGFRKIADYIFGNNTASGSIAMTAPVLHGKTGETGSYTVAFVMPSAYTLETLPKPNNPDVTLRVVPPRKYAALRFSGYAPEDKVARKMEGLLASLKRDNITPLGSPSVAQYNPPWTPPFMRRNEILVEVP